MAVPYTFGNATTSIPLSELDSNFATAITIGNTAVYLGNTTTSFGNVTLNNVTIASGNATVTKITAPTHDAGSGNALTLQSNSTTGLYIDTSQNVGIGTSSPTYQTQIYGTGQSTAALTDAGNKGGSLLLNTPTVNAGDGGALLIGAGGSGAKPFAAIKGLLADGSGNTIGNIAFSTRNATGDTALTERMRIDSSGNVGIGTSSPGYKVDLTINTNSLNGYNVYGSQGGANEQIGYRSVNGNGDGLFVGVNGYSYTGGFGSANLALVTSIGNVALLFGTNNTERMRIDSSGNLLVGTTIQRDTAITTFNGSNTIVSWIYQATNTSGYNGLAIGLQSNGNNTSTYHLRGNTQAVGNWYLYGNGTTSYSSDQRLKKNIETTRDGYLDDVCKLRVVKYNWKNHEDGTPKELGLIAQEVEQIFPGLVQDDLEQVSDEDKTIYKQLKASVLPVMLLKAIQELKAEFDAYKASHP